MGHKPVHSKEQLSFALAWTPKATVQASLSAVPLLLINEAKKNEPDYAQWVQWGQDILGDRHLCNSCVCHFWHTVAVSGQHPPYLKNQ